MLAGHDPFLAVISAADLAAADIVLTTYDVLRADLSRQPELDEFQVITNFEFKILVVAARWALPSCVVSLNWHS